MVKLKFTKRNGAVTLRISEGKERYYKSLNKLLKESPNILRHWDEDKERFVGSSPVHKKINKELDDYKNFYLAIIVNQPNLSAKQVSQYKQPLVEKDDIQTSNLTCSNTNLVDVFLSTVIEREKMKQGCNFEIYVKLQNKCRKLIPNFSTLSFQSIDYDQCLRIAGIFAKHRGYRNTVKSFRALLGRASKEHKINFSILNIGDFKFSDYNPDINEVDHKNPDVLSPQQIKDFMNIDIKNITPSYNDRKQVELYYDFCVFMLHSFLAPCDAMKVRHKDVSKNATLILKRSKTHKTVEIPITPTMQEIIEKYKSTSKNGYVFPIIDDAKESKYKIKDYLKKNFKENLNRWLKFVGNELGTDFNMYSYVFRHTAITFALDNNIPISYVAMTAGTSIEMIQKHYYNGNNEQNANKLQNALMSFSQ